MIKNVPGMEDLANVTKVELIITEIGSVQGV
jgi:hypothetical protein